MYLLRKLCICNCLPTMIFFKVIVVVSIIRKNCVIVIVSIIHFTSIVPSSAYMHPSNTIFERCVFPSVFIDFTNEQFDSTDEVPVYIEVPT